MPPNPFANIAADPEKLRQALALPAPEKTFVIHFTPRSGSSWLTDICEQTGRLGRPGEMFSPRFVPDIARHMGIDNIDDYARAIARDRTVGGVFGFEITFFQLRRTFGGPKPFLAHFQDATHFWLIREDIVAQAVSLSKKAQSRIGHAVHGDADALARADDEFAYDAQDIEKWVGHIRKMEVQAEKFFANYPLTPVRMSYERMTARPPEAVVNEIAKAIGIGPVAGKSTPIRTGHAKIGTDKNADFAARFRKDRAGLIADLEAERAAMLAALDETPDAGRRRGWWPFSR
ncbi:Stf0 family sulfotransferase [Loktanella sp. IMCC34160]|uniref:Stf0 family sulfotransferase n=1 Tax=Loktanella sp. IMCC34160 TaxID=2510646 RepID=UPI0013EC7026|nr:Stf0 family sulfotransferase [Loktanella sp. IMCC34160]